MRRIVKTIVAMSLLSIILVGCSGFGKTTETIEITNQEVKANMKASALAAIQQYFNIDLSKEAQMEEKSYENLMVDQKAGIKTHVSNMFRATTLGQAQEGAVQSYGVILDKDNIGIQGAIIQKFDSSKPKKIEEPNLKVIADEFVANTGVVEKVEEWIYDGIEKAASNKQLSVLRYKNENIDEYLLVGISLQSEEVVYFERALSNK